MCGINGFIGVEKEKLTRMNKLLDYRGPDFSGVFFDEHLSLGHNLLSIREASDLSKQPYLKDNSPWILAFNGQLYNNKDLKAHLDGSYKSVDLDTELLYGMILKYGWNFIDKIHGMFAIVLYNKGEGLLKLYRDATGQKLLYYYHKDNQLIWSSEIKAILSHNNIDQEVDTEAVSLSVSLGYIPGNKTLFRYIQKLNLSEEVSFNLKTKVLSKRYFKSLASDYYKGSDDVFAELTKEHLQSKQKVALNLSGGLDSSLLLHEMSKAGHEMITYTNHFVDCSDSYNTDALLAKKLAKDYGSNHHEIQITKESFFENFIQSYKCIEEPNYNISLPAYFQTAKAEGIHGDKNRVILSGDGGDELFGGYPYYLQSAKIASGMKLLTPFFYNLIKNYRNHSNYDFSKPADRFMFLKDFYFKALLHEDTSGPIYLRKIANDFLNIYGEKTGAIYQSMLMDRALWLGGENFIRSDKLYMSQSLELRSPLSYHPFRIHFDKILREKDYMDPTSNKLFLRNYYKDKLPDYITERKDKSGWRSPIKEWYDPKFKILFLDIISEVENNNHLIDWKKVRQKIERTDTWPGKYIHLYLSLAILSKEYNLNL